MEKDIVILDIQKYNELRDFKQKIEEGNTFYIEYNVGSWVYKKTIITNDQAIINLIEINKEMENEIERLKNVNNMKNKFSYWLFHKF